jgi:acyl-CoA reductase-like NAD-dependent aldehyde dehydrogenase
MTPLVEAAAEDVDRAVTAADRAFHLYRSEPPERRAALLEQIAVEIEALGDDLLRSPSGWPASGPAPFAS